MLSPVSTYQKTMSVKRPEQYSKISGINSNNRVQGKKEHDLKCWFHSL